MRKEKYFIVVLLALLLSPSCAQYSDSRLTKNALCGIWHWESSSGGFSGKQVITPETLGYTKQIQFYPEGGYQAFHGSDLIITANYTVEIKNTIFGSHEVICFSDTTGMLGEKVIFRVTETSLLLSDPHPDGYVHTYIRKED